MQPFATSAASGSDALLEHQCPQCGAGVSLAETDRIFSCPFCRVRLLIAGAGPLSYYIVPPPAIDSRNCFFMPYFRLKGIRYALVGEKIVPTLVDCSAIAAPQPAGFPPTLGIRPQSMRLKFIEPSSPGIFISVKERFDDIKAGFTRAIAFTAALVPSAVEAIGVLPKPFARQHAAAALSVLIGETASCVYTPFYVRDETVFDAIGGQAVCRMNESLVHLLHDSRPVSPVFLSTLCPSCGWDLSGEHDSLVMLCGRCGAAWHTGENALQRIDVDLWDLQTASDAWIPFWRLSVQAGQCRLSSVADFIRLTNAPKAVLPEMEKQQFFLWTPAFKTNPELFLRLCRVMTIHQKAISGDTAAPQDQKAVFFPATLPSSECLEAVPVVLADISTAKRKTLPQLENETFSLCSARLVLVPFILKGREYFQPELNMVITANALKWGRAL